MQLKDLGWSPFFEDQFRAYKDQDYSVMRIIRENREKYIACNDEGEFSCEVTGKFRFENKSKGNFPTTGDWVIAAVIPGEKKAMIHAVLKRKSIFSRKSAGQITEEQPVAANIDIIFIITGLDLNYNLRRIERFLAIAWESGAKPVVVLNKSDLCAEVEQRKCEVESVAMGVDVLAISAFNQKDLAELKKYIKPGITAAFLGSSGAGKSTIINSILGSDLLDVNEVSDVGSRGRHTTTFRELIFLPDGGMVIDTPGMREIQVWGNDDGLAQVFEDIEELAGKCRFADCNHQKEPGCAIREAIDNGSLDPKRFKSYLKLKKEFTYLNDRQNMKASMVEKTRWKNISKLARQIKKHIVILLLLFPMSLFGDGCLPIDSGFSLLHFELGGFNYLTCGIGYSIGLEYSFLFSTYVFELGTVVEYKTIDELRFRVHFRTADPVSFGVSGVVTTDFDVTSAGISPEIGLRLGSICIFYRYNFFYESSFNNHEIILSIYPFRS
ncbi:MAG: ribosome small subunit-dependent GTPase A [Spirochaetaceae bacterium]|nr:MAG: ribosome small subunit-dependent GTPase A [Spirochaetaceae bacterium]